MSKKVIEESLGTKTKMESRTWKITSYDWIMSETIWIHKRRNEEQQLRETKTNFNLINQMIITEKTRTIQ